MTVATAYSPSEVADRLTGRNYLSYSAVSTFQSCPLKFYFKYCLGLPEAVVSASLVFGGAIHAAVEFHFSELLAGNPVPELDALLVVYHDAWNERADKTIQFGKDDDINTLGSLAERMLTAFQASSVARPAGTIIGIEEELFGEVVSDCPNFLARVDLVVDSGDALVVTDFKTARSRWSKEHVADSANQLLLYHELVKPMAEGKPIRLEFTVLTKTKNVMLDAHSVRAEREQVERTKRVVERVWRAIQAGHFYPNPSPMNCPTCPFRAPCRAWTG